jgi:hypothetical protein
LKLFLRNSFDKIIPSCPKAPVIMMFFFFISL